MQEYYELLGVSPTATTEQINQAYRQKMREWIGRQNSANIALRHEAEQMLPKLDEAKNQLLQRVEYHPPEPPVTRYPETQPPVTIDVEPQIYQAELIWEFLTFAYISQISSRLDSAGFSWLENVTYENQTFRYVAQGTGTLIYIDTRPTSFIFAQFPVLSITALRNFFQASINYCHQPFWQNPQGNYCFAVALASSVDNDYAYFIRSENPLTSIGVASSALLLPVIVDLTARQVYFSEKNPLLGLVSWPGMRTIAQQVLTP